MPLQRLSLVGRVELLLQPDALFQRLDVGGRQFAFFLHVPRVLLRRVWRGFREGDDRRCAPVVAQDARNMFGVGMPSYPPCMANNPTGTKLGAASKNCHRELAGE